MSYKSEPVPPLRLEEGSEGLRRVMGGFVFEKLTLSKINVN